MGEVFLDEEVGALMITSIVVLYGNAATRELAGQVAGEVEEAWNESSALVSVKGALFPMRFQIQGRFMPEISPDTIHQNLDPRMNFFRVEKFSRLHISFVDEIGSNTGYFLLDNLTNRSTTAAHEYGHTLGLVHPDDLDIRGQGRPGIMYPRGTLVDPPFQWDPSAPAGAVGGTMNPVYRQVRPADLESLHLERLKLDPMHKGVLGDFTNLFHESH